MTFDALLRHLLDLLIDTIYFVDLPTDKLLRKFPSCRSLAPAEQEERVTFDVIRDILRKRREGATGGSSG